MLKDRTWTGTENEMPDAVPDSSAAADTRERPDYACEIAGIIESNASPRYLRDRLSDYHDNDISDALIKLTPALRKKVYRVLDVEQLSGIFEYSDEDETVGFLSEMDLMKAARVLEKMDPDIAIDVLRATERNKREILLELVNDDFRKAVALLASFDEDEIGSWMSTNYIVIRDNLSVKEAMDELVAQAENNDNISTIFVLDENDVFCGAIDLKDLIIARGTVGGRRKDRKQESSGISGERKKGTGIAGRTGTASGPDGSAGHAGNFGQAEQSARDRNGASKEYKKAGAPELDELVMTSYPYVYGTEDIDDCIERLKDYSEDLIPVLDNQNKLLGVITSKSVLEVVDETMGEDYARLAGLTAVEELEESVTESIKKRLPWLVVLMFLGLIVSSAVGIFEEVISGLTVTMFFQSMILDMSGNSGTQSLAVTIRMLMDEDLTASQKRRHLFKEIRIGFCNGLLLGLGSTICVGIYALVIKGLPAAMAFAVSGCVGAALLAAMTIAVGVGVLVPMFFKSIGIDPAVASGPLITTATDLVSVITYYSLAWLLLIHMMGYGGTA